MRYCGPERWLKVRGWKILWIQGWGLAIVMIDVRGERFRLNEVERGYTGVAGLKGGSFD